MATSSGRAANAAEGARRNELREKEARLRDDPTNEELREEVAEERRAVIERDTAAASSFFMENHDYLFPFVWGGVPKADSLISMVLDHLLNHAPVVPPVIAITLDNASCNKSIHSLRAFGLLLELIPCIQEIHLMFSSVGHTHNSVDAHFGTLRTTMSKKDIGTPTGWLGFFFLVTVFFPPLLRYNFKNCRPR